MSEAFPISDVIKRLSDSLVDLSQSAGRGQNKLAQYLPELKRLQLTLKVYLSQGEKVPHYQQLQSICNFLTGFISRFNTPSAERQKTFHEMRDQMQRAYAHQKKGPPGSHNGNSGPSPPLSALEDLKDTIDYKKMINPGLADVSEYFESPDEMRIQKELQQYQNISFWTRRVTRVFLLVALGLGLLWGAAQTIPVLHFWKSNPAGTPGAVTGLEGAHKIGEFYFETGKYVLSDQQKAILENLKAVLLQPDVQVVLIQGHADPQKFLKEDRNWDLSYQRSRSVMEYLHTSLKIPYEKFKLSSASYYEAKTTEKAKYWLDRRVEIYVLRKAPKAGS